MSRIKIKVVYIALLVIVFCMGYGLTRAAQGEAGTAEAWVICKPGDFVNARETATKKGMLAGRLEPGDRFETDGETRNNFMHIIESSFEAEEAWVHAGYVVDEEPERINRECVIAAEGRVACRKYIDGPRRAWARPGTTVTVYWWTSQWCVTNKGFIRSEYIDTGRE